MCHMKTRLTISVTTSYPISKHYFTLNVHKDLDNMCDSLNLSALKLSWCVMLHNINTAT